MHMVISRNFIPNALKYGGMVITDDILKNMINELEIKDIDTSSKDWTDGISRSAVAVSYVGKDMGIKGLEPALTISQMKKRLEDNKRYKDKECVVYPYVGDIIFFMEMNMDTMVKEERAGIIFRVDRHSLSAVWIVSINYRNEVYVSLLHLYDDNVIGYGAISHLEDMYIDQVLTQSTFYEERGEYDRIARYCGQIIRNEDSDEDLFCYLRVGPGENYNAVSWCPKVYVGNYVEVYDSFADRTPGKGDRLWLFVKIDNFYYGYLPEDRVVPAKYQTIYSSGKVCVGDDVNFLGGHCYSTPFTIEDYEDFQYGPVKVLEINLQSINPYRIGYAMNCELIPCGWVQPDRIEELYR